MMGDLMLQPSASSIEWIRKQKVQTGNASLIQDPDSIRATSFALLKTAKAPSNSANAHVTRKLAKGEAMKTRDRVDARNAQIGLPKQVAADWPLRTVGREIPTALLFMACQAEQGHYPDDQFEIWYREARAAATVSLPYYLEKHCSAAEAIWWENHAAQEARAQGAQEAEELQQGGQGLITHPLPQEGHAEETGPAAPCPLPAVPLGLQVGEPPVVTDATGSTADTDNNSLWPVLEASLADQGMFDPFDPASGDFWI